MTSGSASVWWLSEMGSAWSMGFPIALQVTVCDWMHRNRFFQSPPLKCIWIVRVVKAKAITFHTSLEIPNHGQSDWLSFIVWLLTILRDGSAIIWEHRDVTWLAPSIEWWLCEHQINWFDEVNRKIWLLLGVIGVTGGARHCFEQLLKLPNKCFKIDQFNCKCSNDSK